MFLFKQKNTKKKQPKSSVLQPSSVVMEEIRHMETSQQQQETVRKICDIFGEDNDFTQRGFIVSNDIPANVFYLNSISDKETISKEIIKPLTESNLIIVEVEAAMERVCKNILFHADVKTETKLTRIVEGLLRGQTVLLVEGIKAAFLIDTYKGEKRSISQPETEQVIRGSREGFIENIQSNTALLRAKLPIPDLRVKSVTLGTLTQTNVAYCYIDGIVNEALVKDVEERLANIDVDRIIDAGYVEQFIQDNPRSPFPQVKSTERPDVVVGNLVEGRVSILVDGSPFALIVPATFAQFYQTSEDYNERFIMVSMVRIIRVFALLFSLIMPSLYVAILSYHPELIPTSFAVAITSGRAGVPFPAVIEVFLMEAAMEILREATVRMPKQVGGALSIVGVLVIGQAAVSAGFVSPITVVVIALTTIGSFATPAYNMAIGFRMMRFPLLIMTGLLGFYGLVLGLLFVNNHVLSLRSFGVPYFSPMAPLNVAGLKDTIIRAPLNWLLDRPEELHTRNKRRINPNDLGPSNALSPENIKQSRGGQKDNE
ncbi:spore germination protein [Metabacillus malikii]|uniref:Spore germination protein KA n=1 Tax=Metabacillus malikii TaxID=1504265 RepID=A0ABT9ZN80_9BACI|nr:spore germination protein [Metabacillus malikii]MDQ0233460.1 spore germination protein KA [Metabacillus malikii]